MTKNEVYCLGLITEECGEVQQLIGKALRFGLDAPGGKSYQYQTAREMLHKELGDIIASIIFASEHHIIELDSILMNSENKLKKLCNPNNKDANGFQLAPTP